LSSAFLFFKKIFSFFPRGDIPGQKITNFWHIVAARLRRLNRSRGGGGAAS
jgi:hypothetical protein